MTLKEARQNYYDLSGKLSEIVRQLSFAGIAVIWMFRVGTDTGGIAFAPVLVWPLIFLVGALTLDLCQYLYGSIAWSFYAQKEEKSGKKDDDEVSPRDAINWPSLVFFYSKTVLCILAFLLLVAFLRGKL